MSDKIIARIEAFLNQEDEQTDEAIDALFPDLPDWIPEPNVTRLRHTLKRLLSEISLEGIEAHAKAYGEENHPPYPGSIRDVQRFIDDIGYLAQLAYAVRLGKKEGLILLAGKDAARGRKNVDGAKKGHEETHGTPEEKAARWAGYQAALERVHEEHPTRLIGACQQQVADDAGVSLKTIKRHTQKTW